MTFCSNSNELELPQVGDIWLHVALDQFYLVLDVTPRPWFRVRAVVRAVGLNTSSTTPVQLSAEGLMRNGLWKRFSTLEPVRIPLDTR